MARSTHWQFAGLADLAENYGGGYLHVTTRANIQIREIAPKNATNILEAIQDLGLWSKGSGADNIRNITGTPTAGVDPQELIDTRPYARAMHHHILNDRSLYGLPRKFNIAFDGAGLIGALEDTNDIGFQAVVVNDEHGVAPGVYFRLALGGITGHKDFARDTGVIVSPDEAVEVADKILRVFIEHGDRTNRAKARLKYVLDAWGFDKFLAAVEEKLGRKLLRVDAAAIAVRPRQDRAAHIGVHPQKQPGFNWIGVALPVGRFTPEQARGLAEIARQFGDGGLRLTVWQNVLITGVADEHSRGSCRDDRGARPFDASLADSRRTHRLHGQFRLPFRRRRHQAACGRNRGLLRDGGADRHADQHSSHRLPSFMRAALHRRHRTDRRARAGE